MGVLMTTFTQSHVDFAEGDLEFRYVDGAHLGTGKFRAALEEKAPNIRLTPKKGTRGQQGALTTRVSISGARQALMRGNGVLMAVLPIANVLSIDAWADGDEGWSWNSWSKAGEVNLDEFPRSEVDRIEWFVEQGYAHPDPWGVFAIDDDMYNYVLQVAETGQPLFAVAYGELEMQAPEVVVEFSPLAREAMLVWLDTLAERGLGRFR